MRIAAFTGGRTISSARFRVRQLIKPLSHQSIRVTEFPAAFSSWPPRNRWMRPLWFPATILERIPAVIRSHSFDLTILQREMVSTFNTLEGFTGGPRVMDVDDAVWLHPRGANFQRILKLCDAAICGNSFLSDYVSKTVSNIIEVPTLVDTERFQPIIGTTRGEERPIIGWSGLHAGSKYLLAIERPLKIVLEKYPDAILRIVSDRRPEFNELPPDRIQFVRWSSDYSIEVGTMQNLTVGLMPIDDSLWSRGKCSYKMLLYMACGIPVVVSPFGMNADVLSKADVGFGAKTDDEWVDAISALIESWTLNKSLGENARSVVCDNYSIASQLPNLTKFLKGI